MSIENVQLINLPKILDSRGNLSFFESNNQVPFPINRSYWIYDVPGGEVRGGHAYHKLQEMIVALSGSFDVLVDDGKEKKTISLNRSYTGLYIPAGIWRQLVNFSTNSLALIVADLPYDESDYIREYQDYQNLRNQS